MVHYEFDPSGKIVNQAYYMEVLWHVGDATGNVNCRNVAPPSWQHNSFIDLRALGKTFNSVLLQPPYLIFVGFWRWCISIKRIVLLDFIHRLVSQEQTKLRN
jgi:hypothetical protein